MVAPASARISCRLPPVIRPKPALVTAPRPPQPVVRVIGVAALTVVVVPFVVADARALGGGVRAARTR